MTKIIIVTENDEEIGLKERKEITHDDIYRVSAAWIINSKGESLMAQRGFHKSHDPGRWGPAVAGTVEEGETYDSNIKKEIFEEIGIDDCDIIKGPKLRVSAEYNYFGQWFFCKIDKKAEEFVIEKPNVERVKWFSKDELLGSMNENPEKFIASMTKEKVEERIQMAIDSFK